MKMALRSKITQMGLLLPIFITLLSPVHSQLGASFGEPCGEDILCDPSALLSCINGSCTCIKQKEMSFDDAKKKCVVKSGEKCDYSQQQGKLDCVKNAICNQTGYCECNSRRYERNEQYFGNGEGHCVSKGMGGDNCTSKIGCREDFLLSCENGICACDSSVSILDRKTNKCAFRAGVQCMFGNGYPNYGQMTCVSESSCEYTRRGQEYHSQCVCYPGYLQSNAGICLSSHGTKCQGNTPCHEEFVCINARCQCPFPSHQYFNSTMGKCVSYLRGPCSRNMDGVRVTWPCGNNAECNSTVGEGTVECSCKDGWIESEKRSCRLTFGQPCSNELIEKVGDRHGCDPIGGLVCINDKCACPGLQFFDENKFKCRGLLGAICSVDQDGFCADVTQCNKFRGDDLGVCQGWKI